MTDAIELYQRAINLLPDDADAHFGLGDVYERVKEYDKAIVEYQTAIIADNRQYAAYRNLARIEMQQHKDYARALELLSRPLEYLESLNLASLSHANVYALFTSRAQANLGLKNLKLAQDDLAFVLQLDSNAATAHYLLGEVLAARSDSMSARREWLSCSRIISRDARQRA